jgi:IS4 transposase
MNTGKTLFAQLIDFLPLKTFGRIVARYDGDSRVRTLSCSEQYRAMAFAQPDVHALDLLVPEPGAIYVMDRAYVDFARLHALHQAGAFFVTRAKSNLKARRRYSASTDRTTGIICDQTIALDGHYAKRHYPERLRRIRLRDAETGKMLVFLTNNFDLPALTIAALYKNRWQVELFFKWIKQHLRIKQFYGTLENAVKTQIWIAVSVYVLVAIVKKRLRLDASLYFPDARISFSSLTR